MSLVLIIASIAFSATALVLFFRQKTAPAWALVTVGNALATASEIVDPSWGWAIFSGAVTGYCAFMLFRVRRGAARC